jgi:hypothetical protein
VQIAFVLADADVEKLRLLDPDRDWQEFVTGDRAWVLQTYLRMLRLGLPVTLSSVLPRSGLAVFSAAHRTRIARGPVQRTDAFLLATRQDLGQTLYADAEVVQNPGQADAAARIYLPHWPQPALMPRDPARGLGIRRVEYKGFTGNLHPDFQDRTWPEFLERLGIEWVCDGKSYRRSATDGSALQWNDYRETDLVLAVRPPRADLHARKPATKLYNAWLAGVPAILGHETAYRRLRRDDLDFIEVSDRAEAESAIRRLVEQPQLYARMLERARARAGEFTVERIASLWRQLLVETVPVLAADPRVARRHRWPIAARNAGGRLRRWAKSV